MQRGHRTEGSAFLPRLGATGCITGNAGSHSGVRINVLHAVPVHRAKVAISKGFRHRLGDIGFGEDHKSPVLFDICAVFGGMGDGLDGASMRQQVLLTRTCSQTDSQKIIQGATEWRQSEKAKQEWSRGKARREKLSSRDL